MIHNLNAEVVGMDVVEVNPDKDISGITASAAVKVTMEVMGRVVQIASS
jgi:arginase family enzyme